MKVFSYFNRDFFVEELFIIIVVILNHKNSTFNSLHTIVGAHFRQRCWGEKCLASALFTQRPKHLAVISFFGWPLGHLALSQSLMNNEHFGFKKSKNSGANSEAASRRWVKQKLHMKWDRKPRWIFILCDHICTIHTWRIYIFFALLQEDGWNSCVVWNICSSCVVNSRMRLECFGEHWAASSRHAPLFTQQCYSPTRCYGKFDSHKGLESSGEAYYLDRYSLLVLPMPFKVNAGISFISLFLKHNKIYFFEKKTHMIIIKSSCSKN